MAHFTFRHHDLVQFPILTLKYGLLQSTRHTTEIQNKSTPKQDPFYHNVSIWKFYMKRRWHQMSHIMRHYYKATLWLGLVLPGHCPFLNIFKCLKTVWNTFLIHLYVFFIISFTFFSFFFERERERCVLFWYMIWECFT